MECVICGSETQPSFAKRGHSIETCRTCGHQCARISCPLAHVERVYDDHYFTGGGDGYPDYLGEGPLLRAHGRRYGEILKQHTRPGTVLDVGAAAGFILSGLIDAGWRGVGLEPNARMAGFGRSHLGLDMSVGDLESFSSQQQFDLVTMIQVVAHLHDLTAGFAAAAAVTRPGGYWLIETWDRTSWLARLWGQNWHEYSPPSVVHWFSPDGLARCVHRFGFGKVEQGRPLKVIRAAHAKSLVYHKSRNSRLYALLHALLYPLPDNAPIPYPTFDLFWMLFQKNAGPRGIEVMPAADVGDTLHPLQVGVVAQAERTPDIHETASRSRAHFSFSTSPSFGKQEYPDNVAPLNSFGMGR